jgi:hypothetical protein
MLSKIAGATVGVAKKITPIMTVIDPAASFPEIWLDRLQMIYDYIMGNGNKGMSTVSMSVNFNKDKVSQGWINRFGKYSLR